MLEWMRVLAACVVPTKRWQRSLDRDLVVFNGLPKGPEKKAYKKRVKVLSARIVTYDAEFPTFYKVFGWWGIAYVVSMVLDWFIAGPEKTLVGWSNVYGAAWPLMLVLASVLGVFFTAVMVRGRVPLAGAERDRARTKRRKSGR